METKLIKYWKIELYEERVGISALSQRPREPFLIGYAKEPIFLNKLDGHTFISLATSPDTPESRSVRVSRIDEAKCTPVYEQPVDAFAEAAEPLIEWLNKNANPHSQVVVTCTSAELFVGERIHNTEKFLKD